MSSNGSRRQRHHARRRSRPTSRASARSWPRPSTELQARLDVKARAQAKAAELRGRATTAGRQADPAPSPRPPWRVAVLVGLLAAGAAATDPTRTSHEEAP